MDLFSGFVYGFMGLFNGNNLYRSHALLKRFAGRNYAIGKHPPLLFATGFGDGRRSTHNGHDREREFKATRSFRTFFVQTDGGHSDGVVCEIASLRKNQFGELGRKPLKSVN